MKSDSATPKDIDEYIAGFPDDIQKILRQVRATIKKAAPDATEAIKYRMPTFVLNGNLVHFAAFKKHIGFYPTPTGTKAFQKELSAYKSASSPVGAVLRARSAKGSVQFPLDQPIRLDLISEIVKFRVKENLAKSKAKQK
jgi:uncharacterized protein YdhG (YjbR/CyaY superfamily)